MTRLALVVDFPGPPPAITVGGTVLGGTVREIGEGYTKEQKLLDGLSKRERQVLEGIAAGHSVARIASTIGISRKTINSYRYRIFDHLGVANDVQATLFFLNATTGATP